MADISLKSGEAKWLTFQISDENGAAVDLSSATLAFAMRLRTATTVVMTKADDDFDKSQATLGIVRVYLSIADTASVGSYIGELKIIFEGTNPHIDKSADINIEILKSTTT